MSLNTVRIIAQNKWTVIPMTEEVIMRIKQLAYRLDEDKPPDEDEEPISIDFHISNNLKQAL
jgi:hypothetical protein